MSGKNRLRKIPVLSWISLGYLIVQFLLGNRNIFIMITVVILCGSLAFCFIATIVCKIILLVIDNKNYKILKKQYNWLKAVHYTRYKLYFSSNKEKIELYSQEIQIQGEWLLNTGNYLINNKVYGKRKMSEIQEMVSKTQEMMQKDFLTY